MATFEEAIDVSLVSNALQSKPVISSWKYVPVLFFMRGIILLWESFESFKGQTRKFVIILKRLKQTVWEKF